MLNLHNQLHTHTHTHQNNIHGKSTNLSNSSSQYCDAKDPINQILYPICREEIARDLWHVLRQLIETAHLSKLVIMTAKVTVKVPESEPIQDFFIVDARSTATTIGNDMARTTVTTHWQPVQ